MIQRFLATKPKCSFIATLIEHGNLTNDEFMEEVARYERVYNRNSRDFKDINKKANSWEKIGEKFNLSAAKAEVEFRNIRTGYGYLEDDTFWIGVRCSAKRISKPGMAQSRPSSTNLTAQILDQSDLENCWELLITKLYSAIFPRAQRACTFDISADRNVWLLSALRSFAMVCDYMETSLSLLSLSLSSIKLL